MEDFTITAEALEKTQTLFEAVVYTIVKKICQGEWKPITNGDIEDQFPMSSSRKNIKLHLENLVDKGLVERVESGNRRSKYLYRA